MLPEVLPVDLYDVCCALVNQKNISYLAVKKKRRQSLQTIFCLAMTGLC